jgi:hypothetical protein
MIYIDPSYDVFYRDQLFNLDDPILNRDGQLEPFHRLRSLKAEQGIPVSTADHLLTREGSGGEPRSDYYSFGIERNIDRLAATQSLRMRAFVLMEPPVVAPELYAALPKISNAFERVYLANTQGAGYSLDGVDQNKLRKLHWPIPFRNVLEPHWSNTKRLNRIVIINGLHKPKRAQGEQYSLRITAMSELAEFNAIDLYGKGWDRWWSRSAIWMPYLKNWHRIRSIYRGPCTSKFDVLSQYEFSLCLENMEMKGYITEKLFDCLYSGTIPLYLGAPDITEYIPGDSFVDCRHFESWPDIWKFIKGLSPSRKQEIREAGREFIAGSRCDKYFNSLIDIFGV